MLKLGGTITRDDTDASSVGALFAKDLLADEPSIGPHKGEVQALARFITLVGTVSSNRVVTRAVTAPADSAARNGLFRHLCVVHSPGRARRRVVIIPSAEVDLVHR